jgi:hypothetical protein
MRKVQTTVNFRRGITQEVFLGNSDITKKGFKYRIMALLFLVHYKYLKAANITYIVLNKKIKYKMF